MEVLDTMQPLRPIFENIKDSEPSLQQKTQNLFNHFFLEVWQAGFIAEVYR